MVKKAQLFFTALVVASLLTGCRSSEAFKVSMASYLGKPIDEIIKRFGPPDKEAQLASGGSVYSWSVQRVRDSVLVTKYAMIPMQHHFNCDILVSTKEDRAVESYSYKGNDCKQ